MIKRLRTAVETDFSAGLLQAAKGFSPSNIKSDHLRATDRVFESTRNGVRLFIVLAPGASEIERFTVELGWSTKDRFPDFPRGLGGPTRERKEFANDEFIFRLPELATGRDKWFQIRSPEKTGNPISEAAAKKLVAPLVRNALEMVKSHGMPYFDELVRAKSKTSAP